MSKTKKIFSTLALMFMLSLTLILAGCGGRENELISASITSWYTYITKTEYFAGESFSNNETYVQVKYYDKEKNTEYTLSTPLNKLHEDGFDFEVTGFDSQNAVESQTVTITITSEKYPGTVTTTLNVKIKPEYVVNAEVVNQSEVIKSVYAVGDTLPLDQMQASVVYSNNRTETVNITQDMVSGFDTTTPSVNTKTFKINVDGKELSFKYTVAPAEGYEVFTNGNFKCFRPSTAQGFASASSDLFTGTSRYKSTYGAVEFAYYDLSITYSETGMTSFFNTSGNLIRPNVSISSFKTGEKFNGVSAAVCDFRYTSGTLSAKSYRAVFFTTASNGQLTKQNFFILFENYSNAQMQEVMNNVLSSVKK